MKLFGCGPTGCLLALVVLAGVGGSIYYAGHEETRTCTVESKDRTTKQDGSSSMRVYTEQCGVLGVGDMWWLFKFDSADTYSAIKEGSTYEVTTVGFRVPLLSIFPNIIEAKEVNR